MDRRVAPGPVLYKINHIIYPVSGLVPEFARSVYLQISSANESSLNGTGDMANDSSFQSANLGDAALRALGL